MLAALAWAAAVTLRANVSILGGSADQSENVLRYLTQFWAAPGAPKAALASDPAARKVSLIWGNRILALAASQKQARGGHPEKLFLDECLAAGTLVASPTGWRDIASISAGDVVYSWHEGRVTSAIVRRAWCRGIRPTVAVQFAGRRLRATADHPCRGTDERWHPAETLSRVSAVLTVRFRVGASGQYAEAGCVHGVLSEAGQELLMLPKGAPGRKPRSRWAARSAITDPEWRWPRIASTVAPS